MKNDTSKLPKWAQDRIAHLSNTVERMQRELDAYGKRTNGTGPGWHYCNGSGDYETRYTTADTSQFRINDAGIEFDVTIRDGHMSIRFSPIDGRNGVYIQPEATNAIRLVVRKRDGATA